jgi:hypothetical protein
MIGDMHDGVRTSRAVARLVKQRVMSGNATPDTYGYLSDDPVRGDFDGDKWTFWQKDIRSGRILKFTQSEKDPSRGTLEVIQGDPVSEAKEASMSPWTVGTTLEQAQRQDVYDRIRKGFCARIW